MLSASLVDTNAGRGSDVNSEGQFKGDGHDAKDLTEIGMGTARHAHRRAGRRRQRLSDRRDDRRHVTVTHWLGKHAPRHFPQAQN